MAFIMDQASDCRSVGIAGTHTVRSLGVVAELQKAGKTLYDHWAHKLGTQEELDCRKLQAQADMFLCSANAVTMNG
ncbi:MAG: lactate utilization protein, partial [Chitinophagaceae bacterium]|nr:lactate utilization protein [Chitinophagaceae bacterium]